MTLRDIFLIFPIMWFFPLHQELVIYIQRTLTQSWISKIAVYYLKSDMSSKYH